MTRHTIPALCLSLLLLAGLPPTLIGEEEEHLTRIYRPKHAQADVLAELVRLSGPLVRADPALGVVLVQGRPAQVSMVIETLAEVDTPQPDPPPDPAPPDVVLDLHLVGAFRSEADSFAAPKPVQETIDEIRDTFPFSSYQLLESLTVRTTPDGRIATVRGHIQSQDRVDYSVMLVLADERPTPEAIKLNLIKLELRRTDPALGVEMAQIETQLTAAHGKTLVVGKAGVRGIADGIFLLLAARLD
ncbi:MAG: hypothetical protein OXJ37_05320 [Bryobacterales bacterium]|nr:hypothetical protein [Bryobacterales bacterium]MDE0261805.1 hypothetical protein [Bryobacterales bacterium]MDE0623803.1 hypothetical protein [Bryobacterales bacterium]